MSIFLTKQKIIKDWTDYNGHMNVAYYVLIFDQFGSEVLLTSFNMGEHSSKTTKKSTMVVESHITYDQEVKENDEVDIEDEKVSLVTKIVGYTVGNNPRSLKRYLNTFSLINQIIEDDDENDKDNENIILLFASSNF